MNRIDHRSVPPLNGTDGAQLQRRVLQDLERQWLDNWGTATAAQADVASEPQPSTPASQVREAAGDAGHHTTVSPAEAHSDAASSSQARADTPPSSSDRSRSRDAEGKQQAPADAAQARRLDSKALAGEAAMEPLAAVGAIEAAAGAFSTAKTADASLEPAPGVFLSVALESAVSSAVGGAVAGQAAPPETAPEAEPVAPLFKRTLTSATDWDVGLTNFTLREPAPDHIQATLRDTQLNQAASQLAAQSLARALMEAGYAHARVVVNGQHSQWKRTDPDDAASVTAPTDSFLETETKDRIHGN